MHKGRKSTENLAAFCQLSISVLACFLRNVAGCLSGLWNSVYLHDYLILHFDQIRDIFINVFSIAFHTIEFGIFPWFSNFSVHQSHPGACLNTGWWAPSRGMLVNAEQPGLGWESVT